MISSLKVTRQMSHQDRRAMMTPKRKCSFSSFSECRYVVDGGKTTTFLFAIETPSPSSHDNDQQTNCKQYNIFMPFFSFNNICFVHPIFRFWSLLARSYKNTKILHNLCIHFARQDGQAGKKSNKKITQL